MARRYFSSHMFVALLAAAMLALTGCHSSRKVVVKPSKATIEQMRKDALNHKADAGIIDRMVAEAASWIGTPYSYGSHSRKGTDCSGLVMEVIGKVFEVKTPRSSREQQQWCRQLKRNDLRPGDLVFFATGSDRSRVSHVGIYIGQGDMIHASSSRGVIVSNLDEKYYAQRYHSAGRPSPVEKAYTSKPLKKKKEKKKDKDVAPTAPDVPAGSPAVTPIQPSTPPADTPVMTLDDLLNSPAPASSGSGAAPVPAPAPIVPKVDLDSVISQEIDSIFAVPSFFD